MTAAPLEIERHLRKLEERLLMRTGPAASLAALLADDFVEFGSSGRVFRRDEVVEMLAADDGSTRRWLDDFRVTELAPGVMLATYRAGRATGAGGAAFYTWRCSIWKQAGGDWRMVFHQGTPADLPPG